MAKPAGLDDVLEQVRHLSTLDKVRLIERVAPEIERELTSGSKPRSPRRSLWGFYTVTNAGNFLTWQLPPLPPAAGHSLSVSLQASQPGTLVAQSAVPTSATDPKPNNNLALNVTRVGAPSTDGYGK